MKEKVQKHYLSLKRIHKKWIMVLADVLMIPISLYLAWSLRLGGLVSLSSLRHIWWVFPVITPITVFIFARLGLYRAIIRFIGSRAVWAIFKGSALMALVLWSIAFLSRLSGFPRSIPIIFGLLVFIFVSGSRLAARWFYQWINRNFSHKEVVAIYGAGSSGQQLINALRKGHEYVPIAFFDDNSALWEHSIDGAYVYSPNQLKSVIEEFGIKRILLAMPQASKQQRKRILDLLEPYPVHIQTIPSFPDIVNGLATVDQLKEVELEDLLGRDPIPPRKELFEQCLKSKTVLVTGGGGSIGSELCRQILSARPACLIIYEQSEYALYSIEQELRGLIKAVGIDTELIPLLGSVCNEARIQAIFQRYSPQTVYHAAAYKHVPIVEHNVFEGIRNNVIGTKVVAEAAHIFGCEHFVFVSTDKAVRPTNVMGATKRFAEQVVQQLALHSKTVFSMVRFGNVLGSSGSVIPLFRSQIATGGPVTVTHPDITRFFMTIPEAAQLVIQAGAMAEGGDVFVLDMGAPVKIVDLATRMIELSGFEVRSEETNEGDIAIQYTGLRPGEKLYEELLIGENVTGTVHPKIMRANETYVDSALIIETLGSLAVAELSLNSTLARSVLQKVVSEFQPSSPDRDFLAKKFISFPIDDGTTLN
jgi:FlaA1/EpsC-like NDP-sugar epimerase